MMAADLMSRLVIGIRPDAPLAQAIRLMIQNRVSGLVVIDAEGRAVGMLTEGDLLRRVETGTEGQAPGWFASLFVPGRLAQEYVQTHGRQVSEVMTRKVIGIEENTPAPNVVDVMRRCRIKRVPVLRGEQVVGIVSRADLLGAVGKALGEPTVTPDDDVIRRTIIERLSHERWAHPKSVSIAVEKGAVLLDGCVFDMRERTAVGVLVENVPGVKKMDNRIVCVEPNSGVLIYDPDNDAPSAG
ncbi:MAG: CBS domain-containing protein [Acetobacteraceae bacterium]|nr:CBS domain-containing protein [Acetobacteraceae bacterium]